MRGLNGGEDPFRIPAESSDPALDARAQQRVACFYLSFNPNRDTQVHPDTGCALVP